MRQSEINKQLLATIMRLEAKLAKKPRKPKLKKRLRDSLDLADLTKLRDWLNKQVDSGRLKVNWWIAFLIIRATGCRVGELRFLRWRDVYTLSTEGNFMLSRTYTKTAKDRLLVLSEALQLQLQDFLKEYVTPPSVNLNFLLLPGRGNEILSRETVTKTINRWLAEFNKDVLGGVKKLSSHCFRISLVSRLQTAGASLEVAANVLGHSNPLVTTKTYSRYQMKAKAIRSYLNEIDKEV